MIKLCLVCLALFTLATSASAFPLSGGNGLVNATVVGTYKPSGDMIIVDLILSDCMGNDLYCDSEEPVVLVDSDDKFHKVKGGYNAFGATGIGNAGINSVVCRNLYIYDDISPDMEIKRIRISPSKGDPFSIEWTGVPEVKGLPLSMKFYRLQSTTEPNYQYPHREKNTWIADVKLTNTGNDTVDFKSSEFAIIDQFGYSYDAAESKTEKLLSGESMRISIRFERISKLSRPIDMIYKPSNIKMDISAWS